MVPPVRGQRLGSSVFPDKLHFLSVRHFADARQGDAVEGPWNTAREATPDGEQEFIVLTAMQSQFDGVEPVGMKRRWDADRGKHAVLDACSNAAGAT